MKHLPIILLGCLLLTGVQFALSGCVAEGYANDGVYYGSHRDPWFHDDPWMDGGRRWYRDDTGPGMEIYIHPPRQRRH
jgi:hypothetical protein